MIRIYGILALVGLIILATFFWSKFLLSTGKNIEKVENQKQENETQNKVLTIKKNVHSRQVLNESFGSESNFEWVQKYRCKDCGGK